MITITKKEEVVLNQVEIFNPEYPDGVPIKFLKDEINKSNYKYYVEENPYLSDFDYDQMFAELRALEAEYPMFKSPDSPTERVGN